MNIELKNVTKKFGSFKALDDLTTLIPEGKVTAILGPNGCGKTTLLKYLVNTYAKKMSIAYVPQETYGSLGMSVRDVVALGRYDKSRFYSGETEEDRKLISSAIGYMDLEGYESRNLDSLSSGEKQRAFIARALAQSASWTLLDEPNSNLDVKHSDILMRKLTELSGSSKSFILVLHDINLASLYADHIILMKKGKIMSSGAPSKALSTEILSEAYEVPFVKAEAGDRDIFVSFIEKK